MSLFDDPPHTIDIYLPDAPTYDDGGGVVLNWPSTPSQAGCPCSIDTTGAQPSFRQQVQRITVNNKIGFLTETLSVTLVPSTKLIATDTGRTFIVDGIRSPDRAYYGIPELTYVTCIEIL